MSVTSHHGPSRVRRPRLHERPARGERPADERADRARSRPQPASDVRTWLIAVVVIGIVLLAFTGMVVLTALAGGDTFLS
ncbi:hypothetical protein GCU60_12105 [Blastococcus saxobsidens]|uniref:Uncharacterized protein n=1 Tax=Blastococcus saxobsidens TaxID=138336 RepID=A0A6L9W3Y1_9ACTN|nr:hypothetical protein [Blastococcus saxobsidens]NEK86489.1 hypothetical protein [Blastococcus saxobsidens]